MPCGTSTALWVSGAPATPVPTVNGTLADPWSADSASPRLTACPQGSELSSWTPKGVVFAAVPENCSDGYDADGCGTVTFGVLVVRVPAMPVMSAPGSLLRTVSVIASESPGEMIPSPPPTSLTAVESWWMSSAATAPAGGVSAPTTTVSAIVRAARAIGIGPHIDRDRRSWSPGRLLQPPVQVRRRAERPGRRARG